MERSDFPQVTQPVCWRVRIRISMAQHTSPSSHNTVRPFSYFFVGDTQSSVTQSSAFFQGWTSAHSFGMLRDTLHFIPHRKKEHFKTPNKSWKVVQASSERALQWIRALVGLKVGSVGLSGTKAIEAETGEIEVISSANSALSSHKIFYPVWPL